MSGIQGPTGAQVQAPIAPAQNNGIGTAVKDFFVSVGKGLAECGKAIGKFFTESIPNFFKSLGTRAAEVEATPPVTQNPIERFSGGLLPQGVTVNAQNQLTGEITITQSSKDGTNWSSTAEAALSDTATRFLSSTSTVDLPSGGSLPIPNKAIADIPRMNIQVGDFNTQGRPIDESAEQLRNLAGNNEATTVLSSALNQYMLRPFESFPGPDGSPITIMTAQNYMAPGDLNMIQSYTFTDNSGEQTQIQGKPKQYGLAQFTVSTFPDGDFRVQVEWPIMISGFRNNQDVNNQAPTGGNDQLVRMTVTSEWRIDKNEADQGRLQLTCETPTIARFDGQLQQA